MFLLSKFFPKLLKPEKHRGYDSDAAYGGEKPKDYQCKIVLLDDTELNFTAKVSYNLYPDPVFSAFTCQQGCAHNSKIVKQLATGTECHQPYDFNKINS